MGLPQCLIVRQQSEGSCFSDIVLHYELQCPNLSGKHAQQLSPRQSKLISKWQTLMIQGAKFNVVAELADISGIQEQQVINKLTLTERITAGVVNLYNQIAASVIVDQPDPRSHIARQVHVPG